MCCRNVAFEVNAEGNVSSERRLWERDIIRGRKLYGASNNLVQELRFDDARFHTTPCAPKLCTICLPGIFSFFLVVFVVMETTRHALVIAQLSKRLLT